MFRRFENGYILFYFSVNKLTALSYIVTYEKRNKYVKKETKGPRKKRTRRKIRQNKEKKEKESKRNRRQADIRLGTDYRERERDR